MSTSDRELLLSIQSQIAAQVSSGPTKPPVDPTPPKTDPIPPAPGVQMLGAFNWPQVGQVIEAAFADGVVYAVPCAVPAGYAGFLQHILLGVVGSPNSVSVRIWESPSAGGAVIPGTEVAANTPGNYWNGSSSLSGGRFKPKAGDTYFWNIQITREDGRPPPSVFGIQQSHQ